MTDPTIPGPAEVPAVPAPTAAGGQPGPAATSPQKAVPFLGKESAQQGNQPAGQSAAASPRPSLSDPGLCRCSPRGARTAATPHREQTFSQDRRGELPSCQLSCWLKPTVQALFLMSSNDVRRN